jgi:methylamine methyltransferase corrinoid protein reductive activase
MLAVPGVIADLEPAHLYHRLILLDSEMLPVPGPLVNLREKEVIEEEGLPRPIGITGTGTLAIIHQAMEAGLIALPHIKTADGHLHLGEALFLTEADLLEAGKAIGAVRAGHITLCEEAGITPAEIPTVYMAGASGTYMDAIKAQKLGMIPPCVDTVYQVGNTSLAMARDLVSNPKTLGMMADLANKLRQSHCMFAASKTFKRVFILELSYWTEGMPMSQYREFLKKYRLPDLSPVYGTPKIVRTVKRDIDDLGRMGLKTITDIGRVISLSMDGCRSCLSCVQECPEKALSTIAATEPVTLVLEESLCDGVACRRCERICPDGVFELNRFFREKPQPLKRMSI